MDDYRLFALIFASVVALRFHPRNFELRAGELLGELEADVQSEIEFAHMVSLQALKTFRRERGTLFT